MKVNGFLLSNTSADKRASGTISLDRDALIFETEQGLQRRLPLDQLIITKGGSGNRLLYFAHPHHSGESVYTSDRSILSSSNWLEHPELLSQIKHLKRQGHKGSLVAIGALLCFSLLLFGIYQLKGPMISGIVHQVPPSWENKLGDLVLGQVSLGKRLISDGQELETFLDVVDPMVQLPALSQHDIKFHLLTDGSINAFALPGGHVVIHTGLIQNADSWDEVMGVVGHELAHLSHRHVLRNMMESAGLFLIVQSFLGDVQGLLAVLLDGGTQLLSLKYSRDFEREADDAGFDYICQAGFEPQGMVTFFKKIKSQQKVSQMGEIMEHLSLLSTHPATDERIQEMEERIAQHSPQHQQLIPQHQQLIPQRPAFHTWREKTLLLMPNSTEHDSLSTSTSDSP